MQTLPNEFLRQEALWWRDRSTEDLRTMKAAHPESRPIWRRFAEESLHQYGLVVNEMVRRGMEV